MLGQAGDIPGKSAESDRLRRKDVNNYNSRSYFEYLGMGISRKLFIVHEKWEGLKIGIRFSHPERVTKIL